MKKMAKRAKRSTIITISIILTIVVVACIFIICARNQIIAASEATYITLSSQRDIIKEDFNKVYSYDNFTITSLEDGYQVALNDPTYAITMVCTFDNDFNYIDSNYYEPAIIDNYMLLIAILLGVGAVFSFATVLLRKNLFY